MGPTCPLTVSPKVKGVDLTDPSQPIPERLSIAEFTLRPVTAADAEIDHAAVMESRENLRLWEQSTWPTDDFTVEANRDDLVGLERRHAEHRAFTYTVLDPTGSRSLGCVYVFPTSASFLAKSVVTSVGDGEWSAVDAVIYFWVRQSEMQRDLDKRLLVALREWFRDEWHATHPVFVTNEQFTQQVELIKSTDLALKFELVEPDKTGTYLIFG